MPLLLLVIFLSGLSAESLGAGKERHPCHSWLKQKVLKMEPDDFQALLKQENEFAGVRVALLQSASVFNARCKEIHDTQHYNSADRVRELGLAEQALLGDRKKMLDARLALDGTYRTLLDHLAERQKELKVTTYPPNQKSLRSCQHKISKSWEELGHIKDRAYGIVNVLVDSCKGEVKPEWAQCVRASVACMQKECSAAGGDPSDQNKCMRSCDRYCAGVKP